MKENDGIIEALAQAVSKDPENYPLRLHLAAICLDGGKPEAALAEAMEVLHGQPDNLEALECAARAAEMVGNAQLAQGYRRLLEALRPRAPIAAET